MLGNRKGEGPDRRLLPVIHHQEICFQVKDGAARLAASLAISGLSCPFTVTNSNPEVDIPRVRGVDAHNVMESSLCWQMEARVTQIVATFSLEIPLSRGGGSTRELVFLPSLEELPVELDMDLGELGPLEDIIRPMIVDPVSQQHILPECVLQIYAVPTDVGCEPQGVGHIKVYHQPCRLPTVM